MKIFTVVGARPQFIKTAVVSKELRKRFQEILVHTGQHYDARMSGVFFEELKIPQPDYNLGVNGGSHAEMTAEMLVKIERLLQEEKPNAVLVYGDTNSTLAAALAAAKLHIPLVHVEAGARTCSLTNPEEINRLCTDHISTLLLASTEQSMQNLAKEGLAGRSRFVGDPMYDAFLFYCDASEKAKLYLSLLNGQKILIPQKYYLLTCHREENTVCDDNLIEILDAMNSLEYQTVYPVHPRNRKRVGSICQKYDYHNILLSEPVGYLTSLYLTMHAHKIVTDSGGIQREAFFAKKQCITVLDFQVWPETLVQNRNQLCSAQREEILLKLSTEQAIDENYMPFGDGSASVRIVEALEECIR